MNPLSRMLVAGGVALTVAACGGGNDKASTSTSAGARGYDETIAAVNGICTRARAATKPITQKITGDPKRDAPVLKDLVAENQKYVDELDAIQPDPKLADVFGRFRDSVAEVQAEARRIADSADTLDPDGYRQSIEALDQVDNQNDKIARELGANECAKD